MSNDALYAGEPHDHIPGGNISAHVKGWVVVKGYVFKRSLWSTWSMAAPSYPKTLKKVLKLHPSKIHRERPVSHLLTHD